MLPREFGRRVDTYREQQEQRVEIEKQRFYNMMNAFGVAMNGRKWKWIEPREVPDDFEQRELRALERHLRRRQKRAEA